MIFRQFIFICSMMSATLLFGQSAEQHPVIQAADDFIGSMTQDQKHIALFEFGDRDRYDWHFTVKARPGVSWEQLTQLQRGLVETLLRSALSEIGYGKAREIMQLEMELRRIEGRGPNDTFRHPELYHFCFFGSPSNVDPWGWRFEGHHVSLNFTFINRQLHVIPSFFGASPAVVPDGPNKGRRVLAEEEDLARALFLSLDEGQRKAAHTDLIAPHDLIDVAPSKVAPEHKPEGISSGLMSSKQFRMFEKLIDIYLNKLNDSEKQRYERQIEQQGWDNIYFCWKGSDKVGEGHYYRIQGPEIWIEYDNTQNNNNHIHSIFRGISGDFGRDILSEHYKNYHKN